MGLIKAITGATGGALADQWKEFFYCDALDVDVLMKRGYKRTSGKSSNTKGFDNIITNGSGIAVADGQCMMIVEQGKIVEVCAEPGEYTYDTSTEPSIFTGNLGQGIVDTFKTIGKRFTYGGDTGKDQRVYYFNTKEILDNKFGTATPIMFRVADPEIGFVRTVNIRCNGTYTYKITNPLLFYTELCGNVEEEYLREEIDAQLKSEFIDALIPGFGELSAMRLLPAEIPYHTKELKEVMDTTLKDEWTDRRGITIQKIAMNPITLTPEDMKVISEMEDAVALGGNARMMAGRMAGATADAMTSAASNENGAMTGFMGMGMAMNSMNGAGVMGSVQDLFNKGQEQEVKMQADMQQRAAAAKEAEVAANEWTCECGHVNAGNFCTECGSKKPEPKKWTCSCGQVNEGKFCSNCGSKKPESGKWTCDCGHENEGKFCTECGKPRP